MFFLRVHSVDSEHPLALEITEFRSTTSPSNPNPGSKFSERRGVAHLFRSASHSSLPNPSSRSTVLFIVAVPNYLSFDGFIRFCGSRIDNVSELLFIRYALPQLLTVLFYNSICESEFQFNPNFCVWSLRKK
jgi:BRCA1-associated protein